MSMYMDMDMCMYSSSREGRRSLGRLGFRGIVRQRTRQPHVPIYMAGSQLPVEGLGSAHRHGSTGGLGNPG